MELEKLVVAVHDGQIHGDETFAIAALKRLYRVHVMRTRQFHYLAQAQMRIDVGGYYDPDTGDFDHHQPTAPRRGVKTA